MPVDPLRKSFASTVITKDDAQGIVEAVVNTTGGEPDKQGDVIIPGAWKKAVSASVQKSPKVVWHHENGLTSDRFTVVGKVIGLREAMPGDMDLPVDVKSANRGGLIARMQFNLNTQAGREAYSNIAGGFVDEWSVGFLPEEAEYDKKGGYNAIKSAFPLLEVSPVLMGASPMTATLSAKSTKARFQMDDGKYPINNCSDVSDAWGLRGRSTTHSREQVERHVRHAASELGCNGPWNGKTADLEEALQTASDLIDLSTGDVAVADTPHGTATTRTDDDADTNRKSTSNGDTSMATEPTEGAPEPVVKADDLRSMIADALKDALNKQTDPSTRPTLDGVAVTLEPQDKSEEELVAKGYFTPAAKRTVAHPENFNINWYPRGDIDNFSVARYSYAQSAAQNGLNSYAVNQIAPWEKQYIEAGQRDKLINPITKANMGDMVSGQDGGFLAPEAWNQQLYDLLYPSSVLSQVPVTIQQVPTRVMHWPVLSNNVTVYYVGENAALTPSSPQFRQITATMRKQAVLVYLSNELIRDSSPQADSVLRQHAAIEMALDQDAQILAGSGNTGAPRGLQNLSGFNSSTTGGAHLAYTDLTKGIFNVETLNGSTITRVGQTGCTGIVANPVLKKQIANLTDSNGRPLWDFSLRNVNISGSPVGGAQAPNPGAPLAGFLNVPNWALSNNTNLSSTSPLPTTESSQNIFFGDWRHIIIAQRMDIEFMASNVAGNTFSMDQTAIRLIRRYDMVCPHPEAFFALTSVAS